MSSNRIEKLDWAFDHKSVWQGLRVQAAAERSFGAVLPQDLVRGWRADIERWGAQLDGIRIFSGEGRSLEIASYDPATLRRLHVSKITRCAKGGGGWPGGQLGAVLEDFHRLAPLAEMWSWKSGGEAQTVFPLARPTSWPLLLSLSLFGPLARSLPSFAKAANVWVTGFGFAGERMELCFRPLRPLPERELAAAPAAAPSPSPSRA